MITCLECSNNFDPLHGGHKICSDRCRQRRAQRCEKMRTAMRKSQRQARQLSISKLRYCSVCNSTLVGRRLDADYCGMKCWRVANADKVKQHAKTDMIKHRKRRAKRSKAYCLANAAKLAAKRKMRRSMRSMARIQAEREYHKKYAQTNKDKLAADSLKYYARNKTRINAAKKVRRSNDLSFRLLCNLRSYISTAVKNDKGIKKSKTLTILGCSIIEFRQHLERQFDDKMTWQNYGSYWEIDHVEPCIKFDHSIDADVKRCWHYSNMRPMTASLNRSEGDRGFRKARCHRSVAHRRRTAYP